MRNDRHGPRHCIQQGATGWRSAAVPVCSAIFCVPAGQSITAINAGPQDTKQKGKTQWVARAGDLLAFSVRAEQELCCVLPLVTSIVCGCALCEWHIATTCTHNVWLCGGPGSRGGITACTRCFLFSVFLVSYTNVNQEKTVKSEFSTWIHEKIVFKKLNIV